MWKPKMNIKRSTAGYHSHAIKKSTQMKRKEVDMQRPTPRFVSVQFLIAKYSEKWFTPIYRAFDVFRSHVGSLPCRLTGSANVMATAWTSKLDYKTARFFLKISKEIGKTWRKSLVPDLLFQWLLARTWIRKNTDCFAVYFKTISR